MRFMAWSLLLILNLAWLPGCGDDNTCGAGTHDEDGVCLQDKKKTDGGGGVKDGGGGDADGGSSTASCGNGKLEGSEKCDDGNKNDNDACLSTCKNNTCGDGHVYYGKEECDDANTDNTDVCISNCRLARCGDTYVWKGIEDCDDGNTKGGDTCPANCKKTFTGQPGQVTGKAFLFGLASSAGIVIALGGTTYTTKTDSTGAFAFKNVKTGIYDLKATYPSYQTAEFKNITVIPSATFKVSDLILLRSEHIDTSAKWAGLGDADKTMAWIDIAGTLRQRSTTAGSKSQIVALAVKSAAFVNKGKHLMYLDSKGDLSIIAAGGTKSVKVASKVSHYWFAKTDGWLMIRTTGYKLLFASPDGKTVHTVTSSYKGRSSVLKTKRILVYGEDGLYSLPADGGKPVALDSSKTVTYCGLSINSTSTCSWNGVGLSTDQTRAYYFVKNKTKGEARSVSTTSGTHVKLMTLDWPVSSMSASFTRFGTKDHVMVMESGTKSGYSWRRMRVAPLTGGKLIKLPEYWAYSGYYWYSRIAYAPDGGSVAIESYTYGSSSHRYIHIYPTDGSSSQSVYSNARYVRYLKYSPDGKRLIYVIRPYSSSYYQLRSVSYKGTSATTHNSNMGSYYSSWQYMPLKSELLMAARPSSSSYKVQRVSYNSSSPSTLATCTSNAYLYTVSNEAAMFRCNSSSTYTYYLYRSSQGSAKSLISGTSVSYSLAPDKKAALLWAYSSGGYNYTLADMSSGATTSVAQNQSSTYSIYWVKLSTGSYNFYLRPGSSSKDRSVLCGITKTMTVKPLGKTKVSPSSITTKAGDRFLLFPDTSGTTSTLMVSGIDGCTQVKAHTGANTYSGYYLTPDEKSVVFYADGALYVASLFGGASKLLAKQGSYRLMLDKHLFYAGYASSPKGTISATLAVPLAGGKAVPVDYTLGSTWKGKSDLLYSYQGLYSKSGLRYLDM